MANIKLRDIEGYENFKAECEFFRCEKEYPGWTGIEKYAIITDKTLEELISQYPKIMDAMMPVVLLNAEYAEIRNESIANNRKHERINKLYGSFFEFDDDMDTNDDSSIIDQSDMMLALETSEAMQLLTETQRRRVNYYYLQNMTYEEIARTENANFVSIRESIQSALKKLKKYFVDTL